MPSTLVQLISLGTDGNATPSSRSIDIEGAVRYDMTRKAVFVTNLSPVGMCIAEFSQGFFEIARLVAADGFSYHRAVVLNSLH